MEWVHLGAWGLVIFTPSGTTFFNLQWLCQGRPLMIWLQSSYSMTPWTGSINLMLSIIILYHILSVRLPWAVWSINLQRLNSRGLLWVLVYDVVLLGHLYWQMLYTENSHGSLICARKGAWMCWSSTHDVWQKYWVWYYKHIFFTLSMWCQIIFFIHYYLKNGRLFLPLNKK